LPTKPAGATPPVFYCSSYALACAPPNWANLNGLNLPIRQGTNANVTTRRQHLRDSALRNANQLCDLRLSLTFGELTQGNTYVISHDSLLDLLHTEIISPEDFIGQDKY
jgi:hypothetical protein